ncbi:MAG: hypothetical protein ACK4L7_09965 [Flavobacteriales bacterium]
MSALPSNWKSLCAVLLLTGFFACSGQSSGRGEAIAQSAPQLPADSPEVNVRVNKEYDAHGNLIAFDSSYSIVRRSYGADPRALDSLFRDFRHFFRNQRPLLDDPGFNDLFFQDSLFRYDFFKDDFFRRRMELNRRYMDRMMAEMDSLKNLWFRERWPKPGG